MTGGTMIHGACAPMRWRIFPGTCWRVSTSRSTGARPSVGLVDGKPAAALEARLRPLRPLPDRAAEPPAAGLDQRARGDMAAEIGQPLERAIQSTLAALVLQQPVTVDQVLLQE